MEKEKTAMHQLLNWIALFEAKEGRCPNTTEIENKIYNEMFDVEKKHLEEAHRKGGYNLSLPLSKRVTSEQYYNNKYKGE